MYVKKSNKYNNMPEPAKAAFWFAICSIIQRGIQFIIVPLYTRLLSTIEYGNYSVFMSWVELFTVFCTLNLFYNSYNVGLTKFEKDANRFTSSLVGLSYACTFFVAVVYFIFQKDFNTYLGMTTQLCLLMFLHMFATTSYQFWMAKQRYDYKYKLVIMGTLVIAVGTPTLALCFIMFFQNNDIAVINSKIIVEILLGIPTLFIILKKGKTLVNKVYWKYGILNNIPLIPYYLSQIILNHSDRLMINSMSGSAEAGIYSVAYSAAMLLTVINTAINNAVVPWEFKKLKVKDISGIYNITFSLMVLVMAMNALLIALAPEAMYILASKEYQAAIWIIPPVSCSAFLLFVSQEFINIEFYFEENKFAAYSSVSVAILNVILNYFCIPKFGYIAAGYTTLICYIVFTLIHYYVMRRVCKRNLGDIRIWKAKNILLLSVGLIIFSIFMLINYRRYIIRYIFVLVIAGIVFLKRKSIICSLKMK